MLIQQQRKPLLLCVRVAMLGGCLCCLPSLWLEAAEHFPISGLTQSHRPEHTVWISSGHKVMLVVKRQRQVWRSPWETGTMLGELGASPTGSMSCP